VEAYTKRRLLHDLVIRHPHILLILEPDAILARHTKRASVDVNVPSLHRWPVLSDP
jgi:hypothetical protein